MEDDLGLGERLAAAAAHLGVPFFGFVLPLMVWMTAPPDAFYRLHARRAFSFQVVYFPFYVAFTVAMMSGSAAPLLMCILTGFVLELPQMALALTGRRPLPVPPFLVLRA